MSIFVRFTTIQDSKTSNDSQPPELRWESGWTILIETVTVKTSETRLFATIQLIFKGHISQKQGAENLAKRCASEQNLTFIPPDSHLVTLIQEQSDGAESFVPIRLSPSGSVRRLEGFHFSTLNDAITQIPNLPALGQMPIIHPYFVPRRPS